MRRIVLFSALAIALLVTLTLLEVLEGDEPVTAAGLAFELFETALLAAAISITAFVVIDARKFRRERSNLLVDLKRARADGDRWRTAARVHIEGLGRAIQTQLNEWRLTDSESDIAFLILKGFSHREIANIRDTTEATVRQQARAIYRKSGLASRAELAAFFLEDMLPPSHQRAAEHAPDNVPRIVRS